MKTYKTWIITVLVLAMIIPAIVAGINYYMDPLWCFDTSHQYNQKQEEYNGRIQKTNYLTFHDKQYDGLIIGSSIATIISPYLFGEVPVFNYAINGGRVSEFGPYIEYAKKRNGRDFKFIILALDFIDASGPPVDPADSKKIIADSTSPFYRMKTLLSIDTLAIARRNYLRHKTGMVSYYDRRLVKYMKQIPPEIVTEHMAVRVRDHREKTDTGTYNGFRYNDQYVDALRAIKQANPNTRFYVFTNPVPTPQLDVLLEMKLLDPYFRWLSSIVDVFGECNHFMYPNSVTRQWQINYFDNYHYHSPVGDMIIGVVYHGRRPAEAPDFGMVINRQNFAERSNELKRIFDNLQPTVFPEKK